MLKVENITASKTSIKNIFKKRERFTLNNISFTLEEGNIYGLVGHNGAGKTTLLETIYDLNKFKGKISVNDVDIVNSRDKISFLNGEIDLDYKAIKLARYLDILEDFDYSEFKRLLIKFLGDSHTKVKLSRGQTRLSQIAIALAFKKDIYLLDEPLAGLDYGAKSQVLEEIRNKALDNKIVILSSHELDDITKSIDTAIFIKKGKLIKVANLDQIRENDGQDLKDAYIKEYGGNIRD